MVLSVVFHIVMPLLLIAGQFFLKPHRTLPEVYSVTLLNVEEASSAAGSAPPPPAAEAAPVETPKEAVQPEPIAPEPVVQPEPIVQPEPVQVEPELSEPVTAPDAVSLKPKELDPKKEKKKKLDTKKVVNSAVENIRKKFEAKEDAKRRDRERKLRDQKAAAQAAQREADALADIAREARDRANDARDREVADKLRRIKRGVSTAKGSGSSNGAGQGSGTGDGTAKGAGSSQSGGSSSGSNLAINRYLSAVQVRIQENWVLPDLQSWQANLKATVCLTVLRDGKVIDMVFEEKSANSYFDQFVMKAVRDASPLPPFPEEMTESELEICPIFRPGGLSF